MSTTPVIKSMFQQNNGYEANHFIHESYDDFASDKIPRIIEQQNPIEIYDRNKTLFLYLKDPYYQKPQFSSQEPMFPNDARLRNADYSMKLKVNCEIQIAEYYEETNTHKNFHYEIHNVDIGYIPLMIGSSYCWLSDSQILFKEVQNNQECPYDYFGYFIVNGSEKMLVCQDKIAENKTMLFDKSKNMLNSSFVAEIMSTNEKAFDPPKKLQLTRYSTGIYATKMHNIRDKKAIPVCILFRALGIESEYQITRYIMMNKENDENMFIELKTILLNSEASLYRTQNESLDYLSNYTSVNENDDPRLKARELMRGDFLPHISKTWDSHSCHLKAIYLGYMINRMLQYYLGYQDIDDRDSMINKRVETPGNLMASLFQQSFKQNIIQAKKALRKQLQQNTTLSDRLISSHNINTFIRHQDITNQLRRGLTTGNWSAKNSNQSVRQGIAQPVNRQNFIASLSYMLRVNTNLEKQNGCVIKPRKLHKTQWGYICPFETPEGKNIGLVKNLAVSSKPTTYIDEMYVHKKLWDIGVTPAYTIDGMKGQCWIDVNGAIIGITKEPKNVHDSLKWMKRHGILHAYTGIVWNIDDDTLSIRTDNGRLVRPVFIMYNNETGLTPDIEKGLQNGTITWNNLVHPHTQTSMYHERIDKPIIEYIDPFETTQSLIALDSNQLEKNKNTQDLRSAMPQYTHMEIHKSFIFGNVINITPFVNHNQAPRNSYQTAMTKQAIGEYTSNFAGRYDKSECTVLSNPQKPLVGTIYDGLLPGMSQMPSGMNVVIAVMPYGGYNQEDSIVCNKNSVERGLFAKTSYITYNSKIQMDEATSFKERFADPRDYGVGKEMHFNYNKLNSFGFVEEETPVQEKDIIIGKTCPRRNQNNSKEYYWSDESVAVRGNESYTVDKVAVNNRYFMTQDSGRSEFIKVRMRSYDKPQVGDKFTTRAAQKGLFGLIVNEDDLPRTENGLVPDVIVNSNAFPSRMTCSQLLEMVLGKNCAMRGVYGDGTIFKDVSSEDVGDGLDTLYNMDKYGDEIMYDGCTGEMLQGPVFIGITYLNSLKHMVKNKIHSRAREGATSSLTRLPSHGRKVGGGFRWGELEQWASMASGLCRFLNEKTTICADLYKLHYCRVCGSNLEYNLKYKKLKCKECNETINFGAIRINYCAKLLLQELASMNIGTKIQLKQ